MWKLESTSGGYNQGLPLISPDKNKTREKGETEMHAPKRTERGVWEEVHFPEPIGLMVDGHVELLTPLYAVKDEDGDEIAAIAIHHVGLIEGGNGVTTAKVLCAGLCGHYGCGGTLTVSMN